MTKSTLTRREETISRKAVAATNGVAASPPEPKAGRPKEERIIVVCQTPQQFMDACEEAIRDLAYLKWEEAGCPSGDGHDFWLDAEREVIAARTDAMSMRLS